MSFLKLNEYHVNLDHVIYVQDIGDTLLVYFGAGSKLLSTEVTKGTPETRTLLQAMEAHQ